MAFQITSATKPGFSKTVVDRAADRLMELRVRMGQGGGLDSLTPNELGEYDRLHGVLASGFELKRRGTWLVATDRESDRRRDRDW